MGVNSASTREKLDRLREYLRRQAADGEYYFKSKYIADDLDLTPKEIGNLIAKLRDRETRITIDQWAYANATTWRVTLERE
jgi:hypothetical protein